ncbi:MAG: RNA 2',3'-cyclic phosphodiesterase [Actinomycetota bacterium]
MPRLFVAVWPPGEVLDLIEGLPRPERPGVRWTRRDQWHVTLRFLGSVEERDATALVETLRAMATGVAPTEAVLGPAVTRMGRGVVCVDVAGLGDVAAAVVEATAGFGRPPEDRPFHGHLTLARLKGGGFGGLLGAEVAARWAVEEVQLVESRLHPKGARYESIAVVPLSGMTQ